MKTILITLISLSMLFAACSETNQMDTIDGIYKYRSTLERSVVVFVENGRQLPENEWGDNVYYYIQKHDTLILTQIELKGSQFFIKNSKRGDPFIIRNDMIIEKSNSNESFERKIGLYRNNKVELHHITIFWKDIYKSLVYLWNLSNISPNDFLNNYKDGSYSLNDTTVFIKTIDQYLK